MKKVRSVGTARANHDKSVLSASANEPPAADLQAEEVPSSPRPAGIDDAALNISSPIRVYVAATEEQMLAVKVLEYSIRKHASLPVAVLPLHHSGIEIPKVQNPEVQPRTPFSFQRFIIPEIAGYAGRAIYLDSDMQVFQDIRKLWTMPMHGAQVMAVGDTRSHREPQFSVMLLDCAKLEWDIRRITAQLDEGTLSYDDLMRRMVVAERIGTDIPPQWNSLERFEADRTALLHYTDMVAQPWITVHNANGYLWVRDLLEAVDDGFISAEYVQDHIEKGYVRPSLAYQVKQHREDPLLLPRRIRVLDNSYVPPFHRLAFYQSPSKRRIGWYRYLRNMAGAYLRALR